MNLISRFCLVFVGWTIIGAVLYFGSVVFHVFRGQLLDPHNKELSAEYDEMAMSKGFSAMGIPYSPRSRRRDRSESGCGFDLEFVAAMIFSGITWPIMVCLVNTGYTKAYKQLKDEYDRGIRTRKEKEVS